MALTVMEKLVQAHDPKKEMLKLVGDLSKVEVFKNYVLVGLQIGGEHHKSSIGLGPSKIIRTDKAKLEDVYQSTCGLVLKLGPTAFKVKLEDDTLVDENPCPKAGDWVVFSPGDGRRIQINGVNCRIFHEDNITALIDNPEIITHNTN